MTHASNRPTSPGLSKLALAAMLLAASAVADERTDADLNTPTGRLQNQQIPDDQHRHRVDMESEKADHMPPCMRLLFIVEVC